MLLGVLLVRVPRTEQQADTGPSVLEGPQVSARDAIRTPRFWCLWVILCMNVSAGIGILEKAAPTITDFFADSSTPVSVTAAGFVALLSAADMSGRIVWSSTSDLTGRKNIHRVHLGVGALMYLLIAQFGDSSKPLFIVCALAVLSFHGGGSATIPACPEDLFGTCQVGAVHGRLLTAWSTAGVLGALIVNWITDRQEEAGTSGADLYGTSFFIMIGPLVIGFVANGLVRPVHPRFHIPAPREAADVVSDTSPNPPDGRPLIIFAWPWVGCRSVTDCTNSCVRPRTCSPGERSDTLGPTRGLTEAHNSGHALLSPRPPSYR